MSSNSRGRIPTRLRLVRVAQASAPESQSAPGSKPHALKKSEWVVVDCDDVGSKETGGSKTNRLRFHLARGSYEWPERTVERPVGQGGALTPIAVARVSVAYGRMLTLGAVGEVVPQVLDDLGNKPLRALQESGWDRRRDGALTYAVLVADRRLRNLRASLQAWSKRWHLTDRWCLEIALSTLTHKPNAAGLTWFDPQTSFKGISPPFHGPLAPPLRLRPYDPIQEWRSDYLYYARVDLNPRYKTCSDELTECLNAVSRSSSAVEQDRLLERAHELGDRLLRPRKLAPAKEQRISEYLDRVEAAARAEGLLPVPELRQPQVFSWLAAHQVCGWSFRQIAKASRVYKDSEVYHNAVVRGIKELRHHIGLTARQDRPSAPRRANLKYLIVKVEKALAGELAKERNREAALRRPERRNLTPGERDAQLRAALEILRRSGVTIDQVTEPREALPLTESPPR